MATIYVGDRNPRTILEPDQMCRCITASERFGTTLDDYAYVSYIICILSSAIYMVGGNRRKSATGR